MSDSHFRTVEINGVKMEVDLRTAKRIDTLKVGSRVKVLVKQYGGDTFKTHPGVIVGFDDFINRPSITVAYLATDYSSSSIKFVAINKDSGTDIEIIADVNEKTLEVSRDDVLCRMDAEIEQHRRSIEEVEDRKAYFLRYFSAWFSKDEA